MYRYVPKPKNDVEVISHMMRVVEADATLEGVSRVTLANANLVRVRQAILEHAET